MRTHLPRTPAEIAIYNAGVQDVLTILTGAAKSIALSSKRPVHEAFAVTALESAAEAGRALLFLPPDGDVTPHPCALDALGTTSEEFQSLTRRNAAAIAKLQEGLSP